MTTERERDERRVYLASVINDTDEFNQELIEQGLAHPADVGADMCDPRCSYCDLRKSRHTDKEWDTCRENVAFEFGYTTREKG